MLYEIMSSVKDGIIFNCVCIIYDFCDASGSEPVRLWNIRMLRAEGGDCLSKGCMM